jgi:hypothetical protein
MGKIEERGFHSLIVLSIIIDEVREFINKRLRVNRECLLVKAYQYMYGAYE